MFMKKFSCNVHINLCDNRMEDAETSQYTLSVRNLMNIIDILLRILIVDMAIT